MIIRHPAAAVALAASALSVAARAASAQGAMLDPHCAPAPAPLPVVPTLPQAQSYYQTQLVRDACQKAVDVFQLMAPQLGASVAGGNAVLGTGSALGGLGHFSVGLRANVIQGGLPQLQNVQLSSDGPQRTAIPTNNQVLGLPGAEIGVGLFAGVPVGLTRVGGLDALVSAFYVPNYSSNDFALRTSGGSLKLGVGARLGLLQESRFVPGVSLTYLRRDLPTVAVTARSGDDTLRVSGLDAHTRAWRLVASKRARLLGVAAGVGQDRYQSSASLSAYVAPRTGLGPDAVAYTTPAYDGAIATAEQTLTRTNYFADVRLGVKLVSLVGEVGRSSGGTIAPTYNTFGSHTAGEGY
ncbi:MAG TPA: hypothetical protein VGD56_18290, partial [Gemmatirosa sp.]